MMKAKQNFNYSLTHFEQPEDNCRYLHLFIASYIEQYQLFRDVERYTKIIGLFMCLCSPPNVSLKGLEAVCMFATLSFFIDDQSDKGDVSCLKHYREIVQGLKTPQNKSENALKALLNLVDELAQFNPEKGTPFRQRLLDYIAAQQWERAYINRAQGGFRLKDYFRYRPDAIALLPYLALLKLSENIDERHCHPLQRHQLLFLEQLAVRIAYLDNDICSWESERLEPTALNLVKVLKEESALSWEDSLEEAIRTRNETVELYVRNRDYALQSSDAIALRRYLNLLECSVTGNFEAMERLKLCRLRYELATPIPA